MQDFNTNEHPKMESKISSFIKWMYRTFISNAEYSAHEFRFNNKLFIGVLTDDRLLEIEKHIIETSTDAVIHAHILFDEYCEVVIDEDIPITNVKLAVIGDSLGIRFSSPSIKFPERCFPIGAARYNINGYTISRANDLDLSSADEITFINCVFTNSLQNLDAKPVFLIFIDCEGLTTLTGLNLTKCKLLDIGYVENGTCELKNLSGLPSNMNLLSIHTVECIHESTMYCDITDSFDHNLSTQSTINYSNQSSFFNSISNCNTSFGTVYIAMPLNYKNSLLQFFYLELDDLFFETPQGNPKLSRACDIISNYLKHNVNTNRLLDCQEELIEQGLSIYATI